MRYAMPQQHKGYSLVEVLIAISILLIALVGPLTIAQKSIQKASETKQINTAFFLAQEALEAVINIRETNALLGYVALQENPYGASQLALWDSEQLEVISNLNCTEETPCGIEFQPNSVLVFSCSDSEDACDLFQHFTGRTRYRHDSSGIPTDFRREVIAEVDSERIHVRAIVTWGTKVDQKVELETFVYNIYGNE